MDYMFLIFRSQVNLFKTVLSILYAMMDVLVVFTVRNVFHYTVVLAGYICILHPYACV